MSRSSKEKTPSTQTQDPESAHTSQKSARKSQSSKKVAVAAVQTPHPTLSSSEHETPRTTTTVIADPPVVEKHQHETQQTQSLSPSLPNTETGTGGATSSGMAPTSMEDGSESPDTRLSRAVNNVHLDGEVEFMNVQLEEEVVEEEAKAAPRQPVPQPYARSSSSSSSSRSLPRNKRGQFVRRRKHERPPDPEVEPDEEEQAIKRLKGTTIVGNLVDPQKLFDLFETPAFSVVPAAVVESLTAMITHYPTELGMNNIYVTALAAAALKDREVIEEKKQEKAAPLDLKAKKIADNLTKAWWGDGRLKGEQTLEEWSRLIIELIDFLRPRELREVSIGNFKESKSHIEQADVSELKKVGVSLVKFVKDIANEGLKAMYFLGKVVQRLKGGTQLSWADIEGALGWSKAHLARALELTEFLDEYPLVLRLTVPYTTIHKNIKPVRSFLQISVIAATKWSNLEFEEEGQARTRQRARGFQIFVGMVLLSVFAHTTILELKQQVATKTGWPIIQQRLTYAGKPLSDNARTLSDYNIQKNSNIDLDGRLRGGSDSDSESEPAKVAESDEEQYKEVCEGDGCNRVLGIMVGIYCIEKNGEEKVVCDWCWPDLEEDGWIDYNASTDSEVDEGDEDTAECYKCERTFPCDSTGEWGSPNLKGGAGINFCHDCWDEEADNCYTDDEGDQRWPKNEDSGSKLW